MQFTKMQGIGNDYVYINCFKEHVENPTDLAVRMSDRHFGIGSDGLILIKPSSQADCKMEMYNADGSKGEMCGNGIRCVAKYVYDNGIVKKKNLTVETLAGIKSISLQTEEATDTVSLVTVNMGTPILSPAEIPVLAEGDRAVDIPLMVNGKEHRVTCVSMGNPHAVVFVENTEEIKIEDIGPYFERHEMFPNHINTEFIEVIDRTHLRMRVWERGSGETLACGTGACASLVAAVLNGYTGREVQVELLGGKLEIVWKKEDNCVYMTGSAAAVFSGEWIE